MSLMLSALLFVLIAVAGAVLGKKFWVEPAKAVDRVKAAEVAPAAQQARHPSVMIHELIAKMGDLIPASPKDVTIMQKRMMRAGIRNPNALKVLYGAKAILGISLPIATWLLVGNSDADPSNKAIFVMASAAVGFFGPNEFVKILSGRRQHDIQRGLPNALDLMVISVESGLGLDQAIMQVAKELEHAYPAIAEEFLMVNLELKAGKRRRDALRNLGERAGVEDLKKLVAVLIQADRFGTSVAESLRSHSEYMRVQARQVAEEKAAKLGVKLIFPIFFFILPSLFVITVGPVAVRIVRDLLPMMNSM